MSSGYQTYALYETLVVNWDRLNVFNKLIEFCRVSIPVCFHKVETYSERYRLRYYDSVGANTNQAVFGVWDR